jgi:hypothetical protein
VGVLITRCSLAGLGSSNNLHLLVPRKSVDRFIGHVRDLSSYQGELPRITNTLPTRLLGGYWELLGGQVMGNPAGNPRKASVSIAQLDADGNLALTVVIPS